MRQKFSKIASFERKDVTLPLKEEKNTVPFVENYESKFWDKSINKMLKEKFTLICDHINKCLVDVNSSHRKKERVYSRSKLVKDKILKDIDSFLWSKLSRFSTTREISNLMLVREVLLHDERLLKFFELLYSSKLSFSSKYYRVVSLRKTGGSSATNSSLIKVFRKQEIVLVPGVNSLLADRKSEFFETHNVSGGIGRFNILTNTDLNIKNTLYLKKHALIKESGDIVLLDSISVKKWKDWSPIFWVTAVSIIINSILNKKYITDKFINILWTK